MLISDKPIGTNKDFKLRISVPIGTKLVNVDFDARSLWCHQDVIPEYYDNGFKLIKTSKDVIDLLEQAVKLYGFKARVKE